MGRDAQPTEPTELLWLSAVTWRFPLVGRTRMITEAWLQSGQPTTFVQPPYLRSGLVGQSLLFYGRSWRGGSVDGDLFSFACREMYGDP